MASESSLGCCLLVVAACTPHGVGCAVVNRARKAEEGETRMSVDWDTMSRLLVWRFEQLKGQHRKRRNVKLDFNGHKIPCGKARP